jgi:1,4-dihydroxy-2-naphthoyl-CoA synthase
VVPTGAGERYTSQEAADMGWVNRVVPIADLDDAVDEWCQKLLAKSATALRLSKMAINQDEDRLSGAVTQGMELMTLFHDTDESREGMTAFIEKRSPVFRPVS